MKSTIWLYGGISGAVIIGSMIVTMNLAGPLADADWLGYLTMIVALCGRCTSPPRITRSCETTPSQSWRRVWPRG